VTDAVVEVFAEWGVVPQDVSLSGSPFSSRGRFIM